jgi:quercetin dioxygenase-like cupin family protein
MARSRDLLRASSAVIVSWTLAATSIYGSGAPAGGFGMVVFADRAHVGRAAASVGTTVLNGDTLDTESQGSLQVRTAAARLMLSGASRVTWSAEKSEPAATLTAGTATFSTANSKAFELRVGNAVIRPTGEEPSVGNVSVLNPKELTIHCSRGSLTMTVIDDTLVIPEGTAYHVVLDPNADLGSDNSKAWGGNNQQPRKSGRNRFIFFLIFLSAGVTAFAVYKALESPDRP